MEQIKPIPLFVQGIEKTGTSTLVNILNSHPEIFILYETMINNCRISKYGNQLLEKYPGARTLFRQSKNITDPYLKLAKMIYKDNPNYKYRYIGDKLISLDPSITQPDVPVKTIYTFRDVRTWLSKKQIIKYYRTDLDLVTPAVEYLRYIIKSYQYPDVMHVRLRDLVLQNQKVLVSLSDYLDLSIAEDANHWWMKTGSYAKDDPKRAIKWYIGHPSSKVEPKELDTSVVLNQGSFWNEYLPLFDKYFQAGFFHNFSSLEIDLDLEKLDVLLQYAPLPLNKAYKKIMTERLAPERSFMEVLKERIMGRSRQ